MDEDTEHSRLNATGQPAEANQQEQPASVLSIALNDQNDKKVAKRARLPTVQGWTRELFALTFSSASLITIGILLVVYHGRSIRSFPQAITLNGVISVLATGYKAALLYAVSSALGQSKWNWYTQGVRRLDDFERIDEASRGPLGAFLLLYGRTKKISVVSLAAIVIILALLIDPFSQQLVHFAESQVTVESDTVWTEVFTNIFTIPRVNIETDLDNLRVQQSLFGAIWNNASLYDRKVHCPTGNCKFPSFKTLEWCSKTETIDTSRLSTNCSLITYNPDDFTMINKHYYQTGEKIVDDVVCGWFLDNSTTPLVTFPVQFSLDVLHTGLVLDNPIVNVARFKYHYAAADNGWLLDFMPASTGWACTSLLNISCPLLLINYVFMDAFQGPVQRMEQSVLTLCATEYEIHVSSGVPTKEAVRSQYGRFKINVTEKYPGWVGIGGICFTSSYDYDLYPPFSNDTGFSEPLSSNTTLSFCWRAEGRALDDNPGGEWGWFQWLSFLKMAVFLDQNETAFRGWNLNGDTSYRGAKLKLDSHAILAMVKAKGLKTIMEGITASMNSAWRQMSQERVTGSYINSETIFEISWAWIILPVTLNIFGYVVLVSVIRNSTKTSPGKLWKGSILASLYHGLREECISGNVDTIEAMEKAAEATRVELKFVDREGRMMLSR
ncbi:hypothetical protein F5Y12DRAFT_797566 [Xylaria sp. FL1777]|nr:hypothetical protein F5Y12DRAFT_797566 [Xylaria sp. FL1777]